jgi:hypothetical protein
LNNWHRYKRIVCLSSIGRLTAGGGDEGGQEERRIGKVRDEEERGAPDKGDGTALQLLSASQAAERSALCPQETAFYLSFSNIKVYF